jgi:8-oxo-dGTP pyrophosphatase MutT (NUDIX family)
MSLTYYCDNKCCEIKFSQKVNTKPNIRRGYCKKAGVFIFDPEEKRVLLVQSRGHLWGPPKGTLEIDKEETTVQCAIREVKEETGLNISSEDFQSAIKIKNRALYYYTEKKFEKVEPQNTEDNDANGITWIRIECLQKCIDDGKIFLNEHCKILFQKFLKITFGKNEFIKVVRRK